MPATIIDLSRARRERSRSPEGQRLFWRGVVRLGSHSTTPISDRVEWHLVDGPAPRAAGTHCNAGQHLVETIGQPDGHCVLHGRCGRCGEPVRSGDRKAA